MENETWNTRKKMAQSLIDNNTLIGKSKQEIIEMLGISESLLNVISLKNGLNYQEVLNDFSNADLVRVVTVNISKNGKYDV